MIAWDQMHVMVKDSLLSGVIGADDVALRAELFIQHKLGLIEKSHQFRAFFRIKLKERDNVTL